MHNIRSISDRVESNHFGFVYCKSQPFKAEVAFKISTNEENYVIVYIVVFDKTLPQLYSNLNGLELSGKKFAH